MEGTAQDAPSQQQARPVVVVKERITIRHDADGKSIDQIYLLSFRM